MIEAVVIDIDDTLCMTEAACFELENEALACLGRRPMDRDIHLRTWGQPLMEALPKRSPGVDLSEFFAVYEVLLPEYVTMGRLDVLSEENLATLDALAAGGRGVALLTSRSETEVRHLLADNHLLAGRVGRIYHSGLTRFLKPDPRVFELFLDDSGIRSNRCVYVGDSPGDAAAATGAGLRFIASLQSGVRRPEDFANYQVDAFISDFTEVLDTVAQLDALGH